jgi:signal transduction histidine kinase
MAGMSERAEAIGGKYQVCSMPGKGTRIQVMIPREVVREIYAA